MLEFYVNNFFRLRCDDKQQVEYKPGCSDCYVWVPCWEGYRSVEPSHFKDKNAQDRKTHFWALESVGGDKLMLMRAEVQHPPALPQGNALAGFHFVHALTQKLVMSLRSSDAWNGSWEFAVEVTLPIY